MYTAMHVLVDSSNGDAAAMVPSLYRVEKKRRETSDTYTLTLSPAEGGNAFPFFPGQFNMLYVLGKGEVPISISGDASTNASLVHTVRAVGTVTGAICSLKAGQTVGVRGPFGAPWPVAAAVGSDVLIVAGGIGLAPLRPAIYHILSNRSEYDKVTLMYGARSPEDVLYWNELKRWGGRFDFDVQITVDSAQRDWRGHVGVVTRLIYGARYEPEKTVAMVCGPEIMMRLTAKDLAERGIAQENIYVSMERNMKCAMGFCGHCQFGRKFVCKDGPVFAYARIGPLLNVREL
jgi:NAD(P)H-flavin reductase